MKKYPFVKQEGLKDCGVACLLMIIRYYKGNLSIEYLRDLTHTSKNGTSAYNLINGSNLIGFESYGVKGEIDSLSDVILPCIAHVVINNSYKHYIVIYNIDFMSRYLIIADPSCGIKKMSFDEFSSIWTGVIIVIFPKASIPYKKDIKVTSFIFKSLSNYKSNLVSVFVLSFIIILLKIVCSFYFKYIIEGISISKNYLNSLFYIFLFLSLSKIIINYLRNKVLIILNSKLDFSLISDAFKRIILLPYQFYHNRTSGEIVSKINDLSCARDIISKSFVTLFIDLPLIIVSACFLASISVKLFIFTVLIFFFYLLLSLIYNKIFKSYVDNIKSGRESVNSFMYESISGYETLKGIGIEHNVIDKFNRKYVSLLNNMYLLQNHINNQSLFKDLICDIGNLFILFIGSLYVFDGKLSIGYLITFSSMMVYFLDPIKNIIDMDINFKEGKESITRVISLYENYKDKGIINFRYGNISIRNLCYSFDNKKEILSNINLDINSGDKIMLLGQSGSGKSTLLKLLMRYYDIGRNMITIDGVDINDYKISSLRKNICYISQGEVLFNDTLLNNLKFYARNNDDILDVSSLVMFNEIIDNDMGFNMLIEEQGGNLSGGQRQRVILARALLKNAKIFLIDEGLSQIDVSLERQILTNIFKKYSDKTFVIISHRMENTDLYNRVISLEDGVMIEKKS